MKNTHREMRARSHNGGFDFMPRPSDKYYRDLPAKVGLVRGGGCLWLGGGCAPLALVPLVGHERCTPAAHAFCAASTESRSL